MMGCGEIVKEYILSGRIIEKICGNYYGGDKLLCEECERKAEETYPQGWRGYPGDTCKHGVYVGGVGVDHICRLCELGED